MTNTHLKPLFWHHSFVQDYRKSNPNQKIATLLWSPSDHLIIQQLNEAIEARADVILSELLPDELPETTLLSEHNFFTDRFVFIPPQFSEELAPNSSPKKDALKPLLIYSNDTSQKCSTYQREKSIFKIIEIMRSSETIDSLNVSSTEFNTAKLFHYIDNATKVICFLENPQELLKVRMMTDQLSKPCSILKTGRESPFRYSAVGIRPRVDNSTNEKSLRQLITNAIKNEEKFSSLPYSKELLLLFTQKYKTENWEKALRQKLYLTFAKHIYQNALDPRFWIDPWDYTTLSETESGVRAEKVGRYQRKSIHAFLQYDLQDQGINEHKELIKLQDLLSSWFIERFLFKNNTPQWVEEFKLCVLEYKNWLISSKNAILNWYQKNSKDISASRVSEALFELAFDPSLSENEKEIFLKHSQDFIRVDEQFSRFNSNPQYSLNSFIFEYAQTKEDEFIEKFLEKAKEKRHSAAILNCIKKTPLFLRFDGIILLAKKLRTMDHLSSKFYLPFNQGIIKTFNTQENSLIYNSTHISENESKFKKVFTLLETLRTADNPMTHFHMQLLLYFDKEEGFKKCMTEENNLNKMIYTLLLFLLNYKSETRALHDIVDKNSLGSSTEQLFYILNTALLEETKKVESLFSIFSSENPGHFDGTTDVHPGEFFYAMIIYSSLGKTPEATEQMRKVESCLSSFHLWWESVESKISKQSNIDFNFH